MDTVILYFVLFSVFVVASTYLAYKLYQENKWRERQVQVGWVVWGVLSFLMSLGGFLSVNIVNMTFGLAMVFANTSLLLSYHIESELRVKRFLEAFDSFHAFISSAQNPWKSVAALKKNCYSYVLLFHEIAFAS
jgi:hypothetical protein